MTAAIVTMPENDQCLELFEIIEAAAMKILGVRLRGGHDRREVTAAMPKKMMEMMKHSA